MTFDLHSTSRTDAARVLAAQFQKPVTWTGLTALARELAPRLPAFDPAPAALPPGLRERLVAAMPAASNPPQAAVQARAGFRAMLLLLDSCAVGLAPALARSLSEIWSLPDAPGVFLTLGRFLDSAGFGRDLTPDQFEGLSGGLGIAAGEIDRLLASLSFLGLSRVAPYGDRRKAFHHAAAPLLRRTAGAGAIDAMLAIEAHAYNEYLKTVETPEHHIETLAVIEDAYARVPAEPAPQPPTEQALAGRPRVAFMIYNGNLLAHTEVLLSFLSGLAALDEPPIEPLVLIYGARNGGELGARLTRMGVTWETVGMARPNGYEGMYGHTRERLAALRADAMVLVSMPMHLAYLCRRPVAPIQIWWSMKFPLPNFEALDGRVFYRSLFDRKVEIDGKVWRGGPLAINPPPPPDAAAVEAIRARFPGQRILGTVAREEKIANADYLNAVVGVLRRHPDTCFLWTGRTALAEIQDVFVREGVADRCHFVGWVDPAPYLVAFDLFIETYPLTGIMSAWAMAFGQPIISVGSLGFLGTYLEPILDGSIQVDPADLARIDAVFAPVRSRLPGIWAAHPDQIGAFADALLADPALRRDVGAAQRRYIETFMADEASSAAAQARHFADVVREARAG